MAPTTRTGDGRRKGHGHQITVRGYLEQLFAVAAPPGDGPALSGNLPFAASVRKARNIDFVPSRLIGDVCDPSRRPKGILRRWPALDTLSFATEKHKKGFKRLHFVTSGSDVTGPPRHTHDEAERLRSVRLEVLVPGGRTASEPIAIEGSALARTCFPLDTGGHVQPVTP